MLDNCTCPHCGADLPADAPEGLCPACLLNQAMKTDVGAFDGPLHGANTEPLWFYVSNKQKVGPVPLAQLQQLATSGELRPTDMLLPHGAARWGTAATVPGLFPGRVEVGNTSPPVQPQAHLPLEAPQRIGRYRVLRILGQGGFGVVYLGHDEELHRPVAIKVPLRERVSKPEDAAAYLNEARTVASLDHPHIVPVFDVGRTEDGLCYVVSKFIQGNDLAQKLKEARLPFTESADLLAVIAEALHHAHCRRLVHRDIKPANILIDTSDRPYLADFGLALKEGEAGKEGTAAGTPAYMSPEQVRGEGHRVDGRSDIFSLGVVLYEMLTGRRPFAGESSLDLLMRIVTDEPSPPRQVDNSIPCELERICLKALAKRASERYTTALEMAEDLRHWQSRPAKGPLHESGPSSALQIVPKGLRSFDANDASFFLELLPGPRDREGLPESIRFWKSRIEEKNADKTFSVGLIYGPSGCGKSSLVKAGLLPRLDRNVQVVYVEATADETEFRLLKGLRRLCPDLPTDLTLSEIVTSLRRGRGMGNHQKVLLVLDQFEQWLHARKPAENTELVQALRQCDGERVQAVVLVREDFWIPVSRFMADLEIELVQGRNMALVDLFDRHHARKVLAAMGRAFGALPDALSREQDAFLDQAVAELAQDDKIISVRLALFAEMVKGKPWTPATLQAVGGIEGVGVTFLEETFVAASASPQHRLHQQAAQRVLKALLPDAGTDIKGHMRSRQELLEASGYGSRPIAFEELLRILDGELRLITPTDPDGMDADRPTPSGEQYYQLTHDYLVKALREWLTRKQKETRRGRAELLLADRAAVWNARPENRQLPSLLQWFQIRWLTQKKNWTPSQQKMMGKTRRYHALRSAVALVVLTFILVSAWVTRNHDRWQSKSVYAAGLVHQLENADIAQVPGIVTELKDYRTWADPLLKEANEKANADSRQKLHTSLALLPVDSSQVNYLYERLLKAEPQEVAVIRVALLPHQEVLAGRLWTLVKNPQHDPDERLRGACALALVAPDDPVWQGISKDIASTLVTQPPFEIARWTEALKPVGKALLPVLADMLESEQRGEAQIGAIANVYGAYAAAVPDAYARFEKVLGEEAKADASLDTRLRLAKKKATLAVALAVMGREQGWQQLKHTTDSTVRSYMIEQFAAAGASGKVLLARWKTETDVSIKRGILLSLDNVGLDRATVAPQIARVYREDPDPGMHGVSEWLLRRWGEEALFQEINKTLATGKVEGKRQWYINRQGQTMTVIPRPGVIMMGEKGPQPGERRRGLIDRSYAIASKEVTVAQFRKFSPDHKISASHTPSEDCPVNQVSWYKAAAYCNWLSEQEGIPREEWCYAPNVKGEYAAGMKTAPDALKRTGYRLPTEDEWEFACRADSETAYSCGDGEEVIGKYGWHMGNSAATLHSVGMLKPNDFGLFDMHGNALEWTQDAGPVFPNDTEPMRGKRGGHFGQPAVFLRSSQHQSTPPAFQLFTDGFRPARTIR